MVPSAIFAAVTFLSILVGMLPPPPPVALIINVSLVAFVLISIPAPLATFKISPVASATTSV